MRVAPRALHLHGGGIRRGAGAAHSTDDALGEADPDLLVVVELRMPLEIRDRRTPRLVVALRVEHETVTLAEPPVALRPEIGSRFRERVVDVEDDRLQHSVER